MGHRKNIQFMKGAITRMKSILTIGFLSILAAPGVVITSDSLAAHPDRLDVIDSIGKEGPSYPLRTMNRYRSAMRLAEEWPRTLLGFQDNRPTVTVRWPAPEEAVFLSIFYRH
jgi:hypothetical protein